jgi:hypothetical protein
LHLFQELNIEISHFVPWPNIFSTIAYDYQICFDFNDKIEPVEQVTYTTSQGGVC